MQYQATLKDPWSGFVYHLEDESVLSLIERVETIQNDFILELIEFDKTLNKGEYHGN